MVRERAVRKPKLVFTQPADGVHDSTAVQRPEPKVTYEHSHDRAWDDRWPLGIKLDPTESKVRPLGERALRTIEHSLTVSENGGLFVDVERRARMTDQAHR